MNSATPPPNRRYDEIAWRPPPQTARQAPVFILRPTPSIPVHARLVTPHLLWVDLHWYLGRSVPCTADPQNCPPAVHRSRLNRYGYAYAIQAHTGRLIIVEITTRTASYELQLLNRELDLDGLELRLKRTGGTNRGGIVAEILSHVPWVNRPALPADLAATLQHIWEGDDRKSPYERNDTEGLLPT